MIPDINLLPKLDRDEGGYKTFYMLLAIIALLVMAVMAWFYFNARADVTVLTAEQQQVTTQRDALQAELASMQQANTGSLEESVTFVERVSYPVTPLMDEIQSLLPNNTYLRNYGFAEAAVTFSVDFETLNAVSQYVERLEGSSYFSDAQLGTVSNFEIDPIANEKTDTQKFNEMPRYTVNVTLAIDHVYLATGGVQ